MAKKGEWLHVVLTTRHRQKLLLLPIRIQLFKYIIDLDKAGRFKIDTIGGMADHLHILVNTENTPDLDHFVGEIKSLSEEWYNTNTSNEIQLTWQRNYKSKPVPLNAVRIIRKYIHNQELYHAICCEGTSTGL